MKKVNHIKKEKRIQKKFFKKIITHISMPLFLIFIAFTCILYIYSQNQKKQVIRTCEQNLMDMSSYVDEELDQIVISSNMLTLSRYFFDVFFTYDKIVPKNYYKYTRSVSALSELRSSKSYIDSVFFLDKRNKLIIGSFGTISTDFYFSNVKFATIYNNEDFWYHIKFTNSTLRFLPEEVRNYVTIKSLQPILIQRLGNYACINPLVINIDKAKFSQKLDIFMPTDHTQLYIYNTELNEIIFENDNTNINKKALIPIIQANTPNKSEITIDNTNYIYMSLQSAEAYSNGNTFIALVPKSDINSIIHSYQILGIITLIICGILAFLTSYFNTRKLYQPVQELLDILPHDITTDEFTFLKNKINEILNDNASLKQDFNVVFPGVCEKYIIDILQNNKHNYDQLRIMLEKYHFTFNYPYFTSAMIGFSFSKRFFEDFSPSEQTSIRNKFYDAIQYFISGSYQCYLFQIEEDKLCIIANAENDNSNLDLHESIQKFQKILNIDNEFLTMYAGIGQTYLHLESIHKSWKEARSVYFSITPYSTKKIRVYENDKVTSNFSLTVSEDNHIFNYLINGDYPSLTRLLVNISNRMGESIMSEADVKNIYHQLYYAGTKVLSNKGISEAELMGNQYINFNVQINIFTPNQMINYLTDFYQAICGLTTRDKKISLTEIKEYVDAHFNEDIYLENIAKEFNTSAKYMSRLLKEALDMPYKQYLNYIRIYKAKELLASTNRNIEVIATMVGFNNRTSFIRSFKAVEGISPSAYRDNVKKNHDCNI